MVGPLPALWRIGPADRWPLYLIAILPLLVALPFWLGFLDCDPVIRDGQVSSTIGGQSAIGLTIRQPGSPVIDGNAGLTTHALGYRAAQEILHGRMPWWNAYSGVGMPLAAEYQPATFFPFTLLLVLPQGMLLEHLLLQILAGWGTYALLRQLQVNPFAAMIGGALYAFNGTLAWYGNATVLALPFLPWMLFGIERAKATTELDLRGGWRIFAIAMTLSLLGGFPEAAYLNGLMALAWTVLRIWEAEPEHRWAFVWRMGKGVVVGVFLAAPQIFAFLQYMQNAVVSGHGPSLPDFKFDFVELVPSLIVPYFFGPIYGPFPFSFPIMANLGGYVSAAVLVTAAYGFFARQKPLAWLLAGWTLLALGKMFGVQPAAWLWNIVPGSKLVLVYRYIQPTWLLALTILAAIGLDDLNNGPRRRAILGAGVIALLAAGTIVSWAVAHWDAMFALVDMRYWFVGSLIWFFVSVFVCIGAFWWPWSRKSAVVLGTFLVCESALMFAIPTLSNPPGGAKLDVAAVDFLKNHLGLYRFDTLGPIEPNYSAYFGIASIDANSSPAPKRWADWLPHLDVADTVDNMTGGFRDPAKPTMIQELRRNLTSFEWAGVKYVLASPRQAAELAAQLKLRTAYSDDVMRIYELPHPSPYFEIIKGHCKIAANQRVHAKVDCSTPAILLRRELSYPGWTARVNGTEAAITPYKDLFETVTLPRGESNLRFVYAPPHIIWMWLVALTGLAMLLVPSGYCARRWPWTATGAHGQLQRLIHFGKRDSRA